MADNLPASRKTLAFIMITVFIDTVGLGIIIPVTPNLIVELTGEGITEVAIYGGWLLFLYALAQFLFAPVLGNLSDRFGRRPVLLLSLAAFSIDYLVMGFAMSIYWLFAGRLIAGIAGATFATANAYIADVSQGDEKAQNFGLLGAAWGFGFIIGPVIGGFLSEHGDRVPFFAASLIAALNGLYGFFVLPETLPVSSRRPFSFKRANPVGAILQMRGFPVVLGLMGVFVFLQISHDANPSVWTYYTIHKFNWTPRDIGYSLGAVGICVALVSAVLIRWFIPHCGERNTAYIGLTLLTVGFAGFAFASEGWMMYLYIMPFAMGSLAFPALRSIMSNQIASNSQGELQGALSSISNLTAIFAPLLMTNLFSYFSQADSGYYFPGAAFLTASLLVVIALVAFQQVMARNSIYH